MGVTIEQALDMLSRGETQEQYKKRMERIKRLSNEKYALEDAIEVLGADPRAEKKKKRLKVVTETINSLI